MITTFISHWVTVKITRAVDAHCTNASCAPLNQTPNGTLLFPISSQVAAAATRAVPTASPPTTSCTRTCLFTGWGTDTGSRGCLTNRYALKHGIASIYTFFGFRFVSPFVCPTCFCFCLTPSRCMTSSPSTHITLAPSRDRTFSPIKTHAIGPSKRYDPHLTLAP